MFLAWLPGPGHSKPLFEMLAATAHRVEVEQEASGRPRRPKAVAARVRPQLRIEAAAGSRPAKQDPKMVANVIEWVGGESDEGPGKSAMLLLRSGEDEAAEIPSIWARRKSRSSATRWRN